MKELNKEIKYEVKDKAINIIINFKNKNLVFK